MSLGADSIISDSTCSVNSTAQGQPLLSTSLGASMCSVNSTARDSPRHQRICQPHRFDRRTPDESSSQQSTSLGAVSAIDAVFRATQCAGIGSVSLLGRARHPLDRKFYNTDSVMRVWEHTFK